MRGDARTYAIIGAAMEVHRELGHGFFERVYQVALAKEFALRKIPYAREVSLPIYFKGELLEECIYIADFLCFDSVIVEIKALSQLTGEHFAQVVNELKAARKDIGLLINFGEKSLTHRRFIHSQNVLPHEPLEVSF